METLYPEGTADRVLRIAQMKTETKNLDEISWRLWWEGHDVETELVRTYLLKIASRWDQRLTSVRSAAAIYLGDAEGERDLLDEHFNRKKLRPPLGTVRRRLNNGDAYVEFSNLLANLMLGHAEHDRHQIKILEDSTGYRFSSETDETGTISSGEQAIKLMNEFAQLTFADFAMTLDDDQLQVGRDFAHLMTRSLANVGEIMHDLYGGTGQGYTLASRTFEAMNDGADEQVACLLLMSVLLRDPIVRDNLPTVETQFAHINSVTYVDHQRLRYLKEAVPGLHKLLTPGRLQSAYSSVDGAQSLKEKLAE